jgi:hypothetical protein
MSDAGVRQVLIYCTDYRCGHFRIVPDEADRWPDELRISDIEDKFVCTARAASAVLTFGRTGSHIAGRTNPLQQRSGLAA